MKEENIKKITEETVGWEYAQNLPETYKNFTLRRENRVDGDRYELFAYADDAKHLCATAYFHEETSEYKLRLKRGLVEFCRVDFISGNLDNFTQLMTEHFFPLLDGLARFRANDMPFLLTDKGVMNWEYGANLPETAEGFELICSPTQPYPLANGSYMIIDYTDFALGSSFNIYYNIFRDEFFGETKIKLAPKVIYDFDAPDLKTLEEKLKTNLIEKLRDIRRCSE